MISRVLPVVPPRMLIDAMVDSASSDGVYSIGAVSRMLDVPVGTVRSWGERYGLIRPQRSGGGHRLFSRDQVEQLRFVATQVAAGLTPADAHRLLAQQGVIATGSAPPSPRLAILVAERDPYAAELVEYFLRTEGYEVVLTLDAGDTQHLFDGSSFDLTVVEWLISGGAGATVIADLKARSDRPVLAISGLAMRDAALAAGADAFLLKPFDPLKLVSTVRDLLGTSAYLQKHHGAHP